MAQQKRAGLIAEQLQLDAVPANRAEALKSVQREGWLAAEEAELVQHQINSTWELVPRDKAAGRVLGSRWVYTRKSDAHGKLEARLVVKGYQQREGIDFTETWAPTSRFNTLRTLAAVVAEQNLELCQIDISAAFLNGEIDEEVYMEHPPGYEVGSGLVCRLRKSLYGLRQAPNIWYGTLKTELEKQGFKASNSDPGLFIKDTIKDKVYLLVWVDDMWIAARRQQSISMVKEELAGAFGLRDLGEPAQFLGMEIKRDRARGTIKLAQTKKEAALVRDYGLATEGLKPQATPLPLGIKLVKEGEPLDKSRYPYSALIGSLLYLCTTTRPDLSQAVGVLARYMAAPTVAHWAAAKGVLRYLASTKGYGLSFGSGQGLQLEGYCDADYAGDLDSRRSTTGYAFMLGGAAVAYSSRLQRNVAASTQEAEYMAAAEAVKEALFMRKLLEDLGIPCSGPINIKCDNTAALSLLKNNIVSNRSKHIDVLHHLARERVLSMEVAFSYVQTSDQLADIFTKPLSRDRFKRCVQGLGVMGN